MNDETPVVTPPETAVPITPTPDARPGGGDTQIIDAARPPQDGKHSASTPAAAPPAGDAPPADVGGGDAVGLALTAYEQLDWQELGARDAVAAAVMWAAYQGLRANTAGARIQTAAPTPPPALPEHDREAQVAEARLPREVPGWSPQMRAHLASFGQSQGFSTQEIASIDDPRAVKVLQLAMIGQAAMAQVQRAEQARKFDHVRPPTQVSGQGSASSGPSDRQGADAWMESRRQQLKKKATR